MKGHPIFSPEATRIISQGPPWRDPPEPPDVAPCEWCGGSRGIGYGPCAYCNGTGVESEEQA